MPRGVRVLSSQASRALAAYFVITLAATWPVARALSRNVAWDLGDSVLNMWILSWDCEQLLRILHGEVARLATFFDANIFYPAPLTLAYSEHLLPQALQVLPLYALTRNPILCYNLLFLSTFVLSGWAMFLFVRQLTGNALAGFVAGLLFAFAPYRLPQSSHLQVLSSYWMPLTLYGIRKYFDGDGRLAPLLWAAVALALQSLSCGYYLLYFAPFAALYALWEMASRGRWGDARVWLHFAAAGALAAVITAPLLIPYARIRSGFDMKRSIYEVSRLSADVYSYATVYVGQPVWGKVMQAMPKAEGELFPGLVPVILAIIGLLAAPVRADAEPARGGRRAVVWFFTILAVGHALLAAVAIVQRRIVLDVGLFVLRVTDVTDMLVRAVIAFAVVLALSARARRRTATFLASRGFFLVALLAAMWLSLGPSPLALGRPLSIAAPYRWLFEHVPGFEGVRVPARFGMIVTLMLAALGGYGCDALQRVAWGRAAAWTMAALFLLEGTMVPFLVNGTSPVAGYNAPEARLYRPSQAPAIYREGVKQAQAAVLAELPLGEPDFDLRAIYYSTVHWAKMLNGYSGFFPPHYGRLAFALRDLPRHPELSMDALRAVGTTHVVVHEGAYLGNEGKETSAALRTRGAVELYRDGSDVLLAIPH